MNRSTIEDIVLNVKKPVVFHNLEIPWECFKHTFEEWLSWLYDACPSLAFDSGTLQNGTRPQWERTRTKVQMTAKDFYRDASAHQGHFNDNWASYSYRSIRELPPECRAGVDFGVLGFPDVAEDVSFWIGSKGAHTACHYDTYGCNIVVQVFGRKSWLLFPPEAKLHRSRVPYEESSVYCEENFYSPASYSTVIALENDAYYVVLEPGMVLVIPPKWWHYVETLECSLNFNTWLPLESDTEEHISECLTRLIVKDYSKHLPASSLRHVFNPNELTSLDVPSSSELQNTLRYLLEQQSSNKRQHLAKAGHPTNYLSQNVLDGLLETWVDFVTTVDKLENHEFFHMMKTNGRRFDPDLNRSSDEEETNAAAEHAINLSCHPDLIRLTRESLVGENKINFE
ncbi:HSPB1-associated protein 1 [Wyeomyia smithii]|uniref:HSPB1-associated protein 1 n=1 Tax=Wyeomyia smithii TaxID=174621 RepID=UPI002467DB79|nr:HSPB1-associated protein 1 [Wyeomyia smithii]